MAVAILRDTGRRARVNLRAGDGLMGDPYDPWLMPPGARAEWLTDHMQRRRAVVTYQARKRKRPAPWGSAVDVLVGLAFLALLALSGPHPIDVAVLLGAACLQRVYWKNRLRAVSADRDELELLWLD